MNHFLTLTVILRSYQQNFKQRLISITVPAHLLAPPKFLVLRVSGGVVPGGGTDVAVHYQVHEDQQLAHEVLVVVYGGVMIL